MGEGVRREDTGHCVEVEGIMIYVCFLFIFIAASFFDINRNRTAIKAVTTFYILSIAICFIGLRYYTGADWSAYIKYFNNVDWSDKTYGFGYKALNIFSRSVINDYHFCQFLATVIFCLSIYWFYKKNSNYIFLSLFLAIVFYFSNLFMAQVRQSLAIAMLLLGSNYLIENKWVKYAACVFIATLFHITAVFALVCLLLKVHFPKFLQILLVLLGFILIRFPNITIQFLLLLSNFITGVYHDLIVGYLNSKKFGGGAELNSGLYFYAKQLLALFIILFYKPRSHLNIITVNALIFSVFIHNASISFAMLDRLEPYIGFYAIIGWTHLFDIEFIKKDKNVFFMTFFIFFIFFASSFYMARTRHGVSKLTGRDIQYQYLPYWNVFMHPENAHRKDWGE